MFITIIFFHHPFPLILHFFSLHAGWKQKFPSLLFLFFFSFQGAPSVFLLFKFPCDNWPKAILFHYACTLLPRCGVNITHWFSSWYINCVVLFHSNIYIWNQNINHFYSFVSIIRVIVLELIRSVDWAL